MARLKDEFMVSRRQFILGLGVLLFPVKVLAKARKCRLGVIFMDDSGGSRMVKRFSAPIGQPLATSLMHAGFALQVDPENIDFVTEIRYGRFVLRGNGVNRPGPELFFLLNGDDPGVSLFSLVVPNRKRAKLTVGTVIPYGEH
jgi:hypothetical protein